MSDTHGRGRPLRFLLLVLLCWAGGRVAASQDWWSSVPVLETDVAPLPTAAHGFETIAKMPSSAVAGIRQIPLVPTAYASSPVPRFLATDNQLSKEPFPSFIRAKQLEKPSARPAAAFAEAPLVSELATSGRWSLSSWLFWRDADGRASLAGVGQLGGSQAGIRIAYQLIPDAPEKLAVYARLTSALRHPRAPEAAVGLSFQPLQAIAARLAVERRVALDHDARNAMAVMAVGGIGPLSLPEDVVLEGYGQAGIVGLRRRDAFVDGKLTLLHAIHDTVPLSAGISISGGAQPRVARLDIGPQVEAKFKLGGQAARITAEWRQRIAGNARPGSGPAITLAGDF